MQTQKSREFPGCRIIHTFSQRITPPEVLAARRGINRVNAVSRLGFFQVVEEVAAWVQDQYVGFVREAFTVGAQATIERVELLILTVGLGIDCSGLGITVTANLLGFTIGLSQQHAALTIGVGPNAFGQLVTLG